MIKAPPNSGSLFRNYKHSFSLVLMAIVDADYRFVLVDVGAMGGNSDGGVFGNSDMGVKFKNKELDMPDYGFIPGYEAQGEFPFVLVGDEAFALAVNLMKPYPGRGTGRRPRMQDVFNYRLSRARRVVENAFGILAMRFQIFNRTLNIHPEHAESVTLAAIALHNFLTVPGQNFYDIVSRFDPDQTVRPNALRPTIATGLRPAQVPKHIRDQFAIYFSSREGAVDFQEEYRLLQ